MKDELRLKSILKTAKLPEKRFQHRVPVPPSSTSQKKLRRSFTAKIAQDDAEIAALEKKLGIKSKKRLPQAFRDDGLEELLEGLHGNDDVSGRATGTDQTAGEWLAQKRAHAKFSPGGRDNNDGGCDESHSEDENLILWSPSDGEDFLGEKDKLVDLTESDGPMDSGSDFEGFGSESTGVPASPPHNRTRENPYIAPSSQGNLSSLKYVPPSLRRPSSDSEVLVQLRRRTQGLVNRLTEANLISILGGVERLYRENARQHVTSTLVDLLLISFCEPTILPDTLIILPAGFIAAVYRVIGTDFGAHVIERVVEIFDEHYIRATNAGNSGPAASTSDGSKETSNLITLLAELYIFQVVGSNLLFDYIRLFLQTLSELNAELLLKIIRVSGSQLRQDDPSSLRDIVTMLGPAVVDVGEQNISVRTKFMIESINDLKNNRIKAGAAASAVTAEHTTRMKRTLGSLNNRNIKASEPLRIGLRDIQESDKRGKWWLVGASWGGNTVDSETNSELGVRLAPHAQDHDIGGIESATSDLVQLAREQRMNTDVRRAIFVTIMSASDYLDAHLRLMNLKLKKVQELEIPKVIIHCSGAEKYYNPYYTLIAKKLCDDKKLRMAFQFSLWDLFKRVGEANDNEGFVEDIEDEELVDTRQLVNLSKMFAALIVEGGISLSVLKNVDLRYLQPKTRVFVELLLVTVLLQSQQQSQGKRDEQSVIRIISKVKDTPSMVGGLRYFLKKVVSRTDIAGGENAMATVKWASKVAANVLDGMAVGDTMEI